MRIAFAIAFSVALSACATATSPGPSTSPVSGASPSSGAPSASEAPPRLLSEQPDRATFQKYFSEMGIGRLPAGGKLPFDLQRNVTVFASGDDLQLFGTVLQAVDVSARYFNVDTRQVSDWGRTIRLTPGGFAGGGALGVPPGRYELKVYVGDALVGVFPLEVR